MDAAPSRFVWYELTSRDIVSAAGFYASVIGWSARDGGFPGQAYTLFSAGDATVAGLLPLPAHLAARGVGPHWTGYLGVAEIEETLRRIGQEGGAVHHGPEAIPGVGRLAVVSDPQGAMFSLLQPEAGMQGPAAAAPGTPGHIGWHELLADDWESVFGFYAAVFGWTRGQAVDMGPMGTYQTFHIGDQWAGGMMTRSQHTERPVWLYYFNVDSAGAAAARVKAAGGIVVNGPHQVPGGSWIVQGVDPQGALFAVVGGA